MSTIECIQRIGIGLFIVPMMGIVESIAIGNSFARVNNYRIIPNQELLAIGISNILGSMVGSYPVTGSFSRTAVNSQSGVATPAGGLVTAGVVLTALAVLTPYARYIPDASLAAVIMMAVVDMIDFSLLWRLWRVKRVDLAPWLVTFVVSFLLGVEWGIIAGVGFSLLLLLYPWARPGLQLEARSVMVVQLEQGVRYPGIEHVRTRLLETVVGAHEPRPVVFDVRHMANIDYTTVQGLSELVADVQRLGAVLVFAGLQPQVLGALEAAAVEGLLHAPTVTEAIQMVKVKTACEDDPRQRLLPNLVAAGSQEDEVVGGNGSVEHAASSSNSLSVRL